MLFKFSLYCDGQGEKFFLGSLDMKQDDLDQAKQDLMDRFWMTGWIRQAVSPIVERDELEDDDAEEEHVENRRRDGGPYCSGAGEVPTSSTCYIPCPQCQGKKHYQHRQPVVL